MTPEDITARIEELRALQPGWDADCSAPKPSAESIRLARRAAQWAQELGLCVRCIDADVLGGTAVEVGESASDDKPLAWLSFLNDMKPTALVLRLYASGPLEPSAQLTILTRLVAP